MLVQQTPKALEWENGSVRKKHGLRHIKSLAQMQTDKGTETKKVRDKPYKHPLHIIKNIEISYQNMDMYRSTYTYK